MTFEKTELGVLDFVWKWNKYEFHWLIQWPKTKLRQSENVVSMHEVMKNNIDSLEWSPYSDLTEREREREKRDRLTSLFRESPPVFMSMFLNKIDKLQVLCRTPWTSLHFVLITTWSSSFSHIWFPTKPFLSDEFKDQSKERKTTLSFFFPHISDSSITIQLYI